MERTARIDKEIKRLNRIFKDIGKDKRDAVKSLINNAAFMAITLEDLQAHINEHGCVSQYQNGENQWGSKKSPEVDIHIAMTKNHTAVMRQLADLLPRIDAGEGSDIMDFINSK